MLPNRKSAIEIELIIQTDGSYLIPRGDLQQNAAFLRLLEDAINTDDLENFFAMTEESEQIFGKEFDAAVVLWKLADKLDPPKPEPFVKINNGRLVAVRDIPKGSAVFLTEEEFRLYIKQGKKQ